jgi:hypothetical protein
LLFKFLQLDTSHSYNKCHFLSKSKHPSVCSRLTA